MSRENVKVVRKATEDFHRGDLDALAEAFDDDVVIRTAEGWPERAVHGKAAVRSFFEEYAAAVGHEPVIEELIDAGSVVVVRLHQHLSGKRSGIEGGLFGVRAHGESPFVAWRTQRCRGVRCAAPAGQAGAITKARPLPSPRR